MDFDNSNAPSGAEQSLLEQFSRMGTTDKEDLISQLQKLLGAEVNYNTASFFLDMNNWNLQAAVCSFLDVGKPHPLPKMSLLPDPVASEMKSVEPGMTFQESWYLCNSGVEAWPVGCYAKRCCETSFDFKAPPRVPVPSLSPNAAYRLMVDLTSPMGSGVYQSKWRLCTPDGSYFGDPMWVIVEVVGEGPMTLTQQLSRFSELGGSTPQPNNGSRYNPFESVYRGQQHGGDDMC